MSNSKIYIINIMKRMCVMRCGGTGSEAISSKYEKWRENETNKIKELSNIYGKYYY